MYIYYKPYYEYINIDLLHTNVFHCISLDVSRFLCKWKGTINLISQLYYQIALYELF